MWNDVGLKEALALGQGFYFLVTGSWAIVHIRSFLTVTGPKTDIWLVRTVGAMISVVGAVILLAGLRQAVSPEIMFLAIASSTALSIVDVYYVGKGTISKIYLLDALAEVLLIIFWVAVVILLRP